MLSDIHSIAANLDGVALAEIARQLGAITQVLTCLTVVLVGDMLVGAVRLWVEIRGMRPDD